MATTKYFNQLGLESRPLTHLLQLTATGRDLSETAAATAQEFRVALPANCRVTDVVLDVVALARDKSDATFDDVTISVGDSAGAGTYIPAVQIAAAAGSPVGFAGMDRLGALTLTSTNGTAGAAADLTALKAESEKIGDDVRALAAARGVGKVYTSADYLKVVVTPESGKALADLDVYDIRIYVALQKSGELG